MSQTVTPPDLLKRELEKIVCPIHHSHAVIDIVNDLPKLRNACCDELYSLVKNEAVRLERVTFLNTWGKLVENLKER